MYDAGIIVSGGFNNSGLIVVEPVEYTDQYPQLDAINAGQFTLTGGGTVALEGHFAGFYGFAGATIDNVDNLITGSGDVGSGDFNMAGSVALINSSTIDATGQLLVNAFAGDRNAGLIEATGTGTLNLVYRVENAGGTIAAFGSAAQVVLDSSNNSAAAPAIPSLSRRRLSIRSPVAAPAPSCWPPSWMPSLASICR